MEGSRMEENRTSENNENANGRRESVGYNEQCSYDSFGVDVVGRSSSGEGAMMETI